MQLYVNQATGYAGQHIWCLSEARINWEGCGRKDIQHKKWGDDGGGSLISPEWRSARLSVSLTLSLHHLAVCDGYRDGIGKVSIMLRFPFNHSD